VETPVLLRTLAAALDAPGAPAAGEHLLVAVSAGPDSTALLAALTELAPPRRLRLTAAHVEHGLRGAEGAADAGRVRALAAALGVPCVARAVTVRAERASRPRRAARYRALAGAAGEVGADRIVTCTQDDQVETLLRLLRGAGRGGLGACAPCAGASSARSG
jgi:tRNA(Ile)-lysidine synthase